jgi:hypothetical protein
MLLFHMFFDFRFRHIYFRFRLLAIFAIFAALPPPQAIRRRRRRRFSLRALAATPMLFRRRHFIFAVISPPPPLPFLFDYASPIFQADCMPPIRRHADAAFFIDID